MKFRSHNPVRRLRWLLAVLLPFWAHATNVELRLPETSLIGGLAVGASTKSYEQFTLSESIDRIRQAGAQVVEFHLGQAMSPTERDLVLSDAMTDVQIANLKRKINSSSAKLVAARVRFGNNHSANTRLFEWADRLEVQVLVGDPPVEQFDNIEKLIRKFNIGVALFTGPKAASSSTVRPGSGSAWIDPKAIMFALRGRDPRFGIVVNILNVVRAGLDPYQVLSDLRTRLAGIQLCDLNALTPQARPVPFGTGRFDFRRLLDQLDTERFDGYLVFDWPADVPEHRDDLARGLEFIRTQMAEVRRANLLRLASRGVSPASGLTYEVLVQGEIPEPTHVAACPDGSIWFSSRRGFLWSWSESTRTNHLVAQLGVNTGGQRGFSRFAFDPGFLTNGHVYVYHAPMLASGNTNRVSRFTAVTNGPSWRLVMDSERVLLDIPSSHHGQSQGGGLLFHPVDGCLYVGTGDNNLPEDTPKFFDDPANAPQNLLDLRGKVLRIRPNGEIPADNPFVRTNGALPQIFAFGFRNPFSLSVEPRTGTVLVGDVGYNRRQDWEEINRLVPGANYGWPRCDGRHRDTLANTPCPIGEAIGPWFGYPHDSASCVVVGPSLDAAPAGWPRAFSQGLVYADFSRRIIRFAQVDAQRQSITNTIPLCSGLSGGPTSICQSASGDLYVVEYTGWLSANPLDRLARIRFRPAVAATPRTSAPPSSPTPRPATAPAPGSPTSNSPANLRRTP